jgi:hypothetical protein
MVQGMEFKRVFITFQYCGCWNSQDAKRSGYAETACIYPPHFSFAVSSFLPEVC